ncbi:MAG: hypothetical protein ACLR6J_14190, partial [Parabacteroides merdae]
LEIYEDSKQTEGSAIFPICGGLYDWVATLFISVWGCMIWLLFLSPHNIVLEKVQAKKKIA